MKKLLYGIIVLLVFTSCNQEVKKQSFTIDYFKSNKWCTMESVDQRCCEFNDNEMKVTKNGQPEAALNVLFEQKNDSLIIVKITGETGFKNNFKMKSLDTLYLSLGDEVEMFKKLYRVK
jgi:hypothetical protein